MRVLLLLVLLLAACAPVRAPEVASEPAATPVTAPAESLEVSCTPTAPDMLGPFYVPGAPVRDQVGKGYTLRGVVRSAQDCRILAEAMVELWMAGPDGAYDDAYRAVVYSDENGAYQFESHAPPPYSGRPPHIHLRVTAAEHAVLVTQHYPEQGVTEATFDLVLLPQ
jgi:protocatechuate 3,4-dioxygenase beta subunit